MASLLAGFAACIVASFGFGTYIVPLKHYDMGDGLFVQFMMGTAIVFCGLVVNAFTQFPTFYPLAMLGGALWATANVTAVPIVHMIGMGKGMLIWSFSNCVFGWASGRFGWFGIHPQPPKSDWLNYGGLFLSLVGAVMFAFVKSVGTEVSDDVAPLLNDQQANENEAGDTEEIAGDGVVRVGVATRTSRSDSGSPSGGGISLNLSRHQKEFWGVVLSLLAGAGYGLCFAPVRYMQDNYREAPQEGLDYVFAHFCGTYLTCTLFFLVYCAYTNNRPHMNRRIAFPAFCAGVMFSVAQASWFVANQNLSEAVSFPIITRFPAVIATVWGVVYFREVKGRSNLNILFWAIMITVVGGIMVGLSKATAWPSL